jgi:recombination protein RecT
MPDVKNAVVTQTPADLAIDNKFIDQLSTQLTQKEQLGLTFPTNYSVTNALNSAYLIIKDLTVSKKQGNDWNQVPALQCCTKQSIASALIDMTVQGLNPMKKQCYFVAYGDKLTLMRSYQGTMAVAKRVGIKRTPYAQIIYEGDSFKYHIENGLYVIDEHVQDFMNIDNEKIKGAYAILETDDGQYVEIMNIAQIKKAWGKGKGYDEKKSNDVHNEFADQMAKKTVINRACKNFINSSDDGNLTESFNETSENENTDYVANEVQHDIETNANSEEFIEPEVLQGDVVEAPQKKTEPEKKDKQTKPPVTAPDKPDWMQEG